MTDENINELFLRYQQTKDVALRNQIAEKYLYITDILAKTFSGRGVEYDDLKQVAAYALLRGIDRFDPSRGVQFTTFITSTITGEIKNYFRDKSRMIKLPRRLSEIAGQVRRFSAEYEAKNGKKPSVHLIGETLFLSEEEVVQALEVGGTLSLDGIESNEEGENVSLYALIADDEDAYEEFEKKEILRSAMKDFSDTEKAIIKYRYVDELSQSETAERLGGVSQMFVSRMERKVLAKLKETLKDSMG